MCNIIKEKCINVDSEMLHIDLNGRKCYVYSPHYYYYFQNLEAATSSIEVCVG